jgi:hypothetical protein
LIGWLERWPRAHWFAERFLVARCFRHRPIVHGHTYESGYCLYDGYRECSRCGTFLGYVEEPPR